MIRDTGLNSLFQGFIITFLILSFHLPFIINWDSSVIQIGDNLDSSLPMYHSLGQSSNFFSFKESSLVEGYNEQLYRNVLWAPWNISSIVFWLFKSPWDAYFINMLAINLISFFGMFFLLRKIFGKGNFWIIVILSFSYMALPRYTLFGGAVYSGLPLVLFFFLSLLEAPNWLKALGFFLLPCTVGLVIGGFAVFLFLSVLFSIYLLQKLVRLKDLWIMIVYALGVFFADLNLFIFKLTEPFISQRVVRATQLSNEEYSMGNYFHAVVSLFERDGFNEQTSSPKYIIISFVIFLGLLFVSSISSQLTIRENKLNKKYRSFFSVSAASIIFIVVFYVGLRNNFFESFLPGLFTQFDLSRISSLLPALFYIVFAYMLFSILKVPRFGMLIGIVLLFLNLTHVIRGNDGWKENAKLLISRDFSANDHANLVSFKRYYAEGFYEEIKNKIPAITEEKAKVMHYGIHPGVSAVAGVNAVDFYLNIYPHKYNLLFQEFLSEQKGSSYYNELSGWGNRAYFVDLFLLEKWEYKDKVISGNLKTLEPKFNWKALNREGVKYVISAVEFINHNSLIEIMEYIDPQMAYQKLYVYEIKKTNQLNAPDV